jgi:drug/metabolite transporter (DMT)-like permease
VAGAVWDERLSPGSLVLQAGYRASDLSLVYPLARGSGPLLSFAGAVLFLGERLTWLAALGLACVVAGILLVAGLIRQPHRAPRAGVFYGLLTGAFIACYTLNDGWAVKELGITPIFIDFTGNLVRIVVLTPFALRAGSTIREEVGRYGAAAAVVSVLGPVGYILVLYAMRMAPISHVAPARELATLLGAYFGSRLLREGAAPERLVGAALIVAGVISLAFAQ